jgi:catechol 2,3-dioxygenase-like lactoylglutathione lyase family enzyme
MSFNLKKNKIIQIGILVNDIKKSAERWADFLDIEPPNVFQSEKYKDSNAIYMGSPCKGRIYQVLLEFDNIQLELIQPVDDEPSIWKDCLGSKGEYIHHIAFEAKNMPECIEDLDKKGFSTLQKGDYPGGRYAYFDSQKNLGIIFELLETL